MKTLGAQDWPRFSRNQEYQSCITEMQNNVAVIPCYCWTSSSLWKNVPLLFLYFCSITWYNMKTVFSVGVAVVASVHTMNHSHELLSLFWLFYCYSKLFCCGLFIVIQSCCFCDLLLLDYFWQSEKVFDIYIIWLHQNKIIVIFVISVLQMAGM